MQSVKEIAKGKGPTRKRELNELDRKLAELAKQEDELQDLLRRRQFEQAQAQPAPAGIAFADPAAVAQGQATAGAMAAIIAEIDEELSTVQTHKTQVSRALAELISAHRERAATREELVREMAKRTAELQAGIDKIDTWFAE